MKRKREPEYEDVGYYNPGEAWRILRELEELGIRFKIDTTDSSICDQSPVIAKNGGTFGSGAKVLLRIWSEDREIFHSMHQGRFGV